jgi:uncharacterized protein YmfQ (DUF2313 family)
MTIRSASADDVSTYSDRDRTRALKDEKEQLERGLKTGEEKDFYRRELEKMGWQITSVNYDKPDYLEYEIVKGKSSYEVQVDFDKNSHKATKIDVATNVWKTDATERALRDGKKVDYPNKTTANPSRFSDRDRMKTAKNEEDSLEKQLKTGEQKDFYKRQLEKMGWKVTSVNYDKPDYVEYEIVKGDATYEVQIDFDRNSHKATKVDVTTNAWKADPTEKALKQTQARRLFSLTGAVPGHRPPNGGNHVSRNNFVAIRNTAWSYCPTVVFRHHWLNNQNWLRTNKGVRVRLLKSVFNPAPRNRVLDSLDCLPS